MNETKKQIIELIWDYMDKSLSEGCLIDWFQSWIRTWNIDRCEWYFIWFFEYKIPTIYSKEKWITQLRTDFKILWHYDITAVLKFIKAKHSARSELYYEIDIYIKWDFLNINASWTIDDFTENSYCDDDKIWTIPNKPLHLYTEQEEKDLLELLFKLK